MQLSFSPSRGAAFFVKKLLFCFFILGFVLWLFSPVFAVTFYVSNNGSDANSGGSSDPWKTITYALTRVTTGDTIRVETGLYNYGNGEAFPLCINFPVSLLGEVGVTIEGNATTETLTVNAGSGITTVEGFLVSVADGVTVRSLVSLSGAGSVNFSRNFVNGKSRAARNAVDGGSSSSVSRTFIFSNNVVANCTWGIGARDAEARIINNTVWNCESGIGFSDDVDGTIKNCVVAGCSTAMQVVPGSTGTAARCSYNMTYQNRLNYENITPEASCIDTNPYFCSTQEGFLNVRLQSSSEGYPITSPGIDGGDPADDYSLEPQPNGSRINMGAYGGTSNAELSWPGSTESKSITIIAPNGGESWLAGDTHNITWTSTGEITAVKIEYSTDGFGSAHTIVASTENDGTYGWAVEEDPSSTVKVRISDASDSSINTVSAADFTILSSAYRIASGQILSYPTPWRPQSDAAIKMAYYLDSDQATRLLIASVGGEMVYSGAYVAGSNGGKAGYNEIVWNGRTSYGTVVGNGIYIIKLVAGNRQIAKGYLTVLD